LLTGHLGKGPQSDWVLILGTEDGCVSDFLATTTTGLEEEACVLSEAPGGAYGVVLAGHLGSL
jgi:DNA helicase II / ATP-dependent DNA helicase PcrA